MFRWPDGFEPTGFFWVCGIVGALWVVGGVWFLRRLWHWNRLVRVYDSQSSFLAPWGLRVAQFGTIALTFGLLLFLLSWRPLSWETRAQQTIEGQHIFFLLDVSRSMWIEDRAPSRLEAVKRAIEVAVRKAGAHNAYGLMVFASSFYFVAPLTTDIDTFLFLLKQIEPGMLQDQGTRLASALSSLLKLSDEVLTKANVGEAQSLPTFVVVSDGEDFSTSSFRLKGYEKYRGRFVFVGVGEDKPMPVPQWIEGRKSYLFDVQGKMIMSRPNFNELKKLAQTTGSAFYPFSESLLQKIVSEVGLGTSLGQVIQNRVARPTYGWWGMLLCVLILLKVLWRYRISVWGIVMFLGLEGLMYGSPLSIWRHQAAQEAFRNNDVEGARKHLTKNIQDEEAKKIELYNLGVLEAEQGDAVSAQDHFSESVAQGSADLNHQDPAEQKAQVYGRFNQGVMAYRQGQPDQALEYFKQSLDEAGQIQAPAPWLPAFKENARWHLTQSVEAIEKKQQQQKQQELSGTPSEEVFKEDPQGQHHLERSESGDKKLLEEKSETQGNPDDQDRAQAEALRKRLLEQKLKQEMEHTDMRPMILKPHQEGQEDQSETEDAGPAY